MFEWLSSIPQAELVVYGGGLGAVLAGMVAGYAGNRKGKPTPGAVLDAVKASTCSAPVLAGEMVEIKRLMMEDNLRLRDLQRDHADMMADLQFIRDNVIVIGARKD